MLLSKEEFMKIKKELVEGKEEEEEEEKNFPLYLNHVIMCVMR